MSFISFTSSSICRSVDSARNTLERRGGTVGNVSTVSSDDERLGAGRGGILGMTLFSSVVKS